MNVKKPNQTKPKNKQTENQPLNIIIYDHFILSACANHQGKQPIKVMVSIKGVDCLLNSCLQSLRIQLDGGTSVEQWQAHREGWAYACHRPMLARPLFTCGAEMLSCEDAFCSQILCLQYIHAPICVLFKCVLRIIKCHTYVVWCTDV